MLFPKLFFQFPAILVQELLCQKEVSLYLAALFFSPRASLFSSPCHDSALDLQHPLARSFTGQLLA